MFQEDDRLSRDVQKALAELASAPELQISGKRVTPGSVDEFIAHLNAYDGPLLIIDSHGDHPKDENIGGLIIGGKPVDIWTLRGKINVPPIVVLSACGTHPFDRSHATVANGFLVCGAIAVLATVLPIRSPDAARFLARLIVRAVCYGDAMNHEGIAVPWSNIVGGALRMQLARDIVRGLVSRKMIPLEQAQEIHLKANNDLNPLRPDWLERLRTRCSEAGGFDQSRWQVAFDDILAGSDVIRYVNLGNPDSIMVADDRVFQRYAVES